MDLNFLDKKATEKGRKKKKEPGFGGSITGAILILMIITALYLLIADAPKKTPEISISDLAKSVSAGEVKQILVKGEELTVTYTNDETRKAKKEAGTSLSHTLFNYGVESGALSSTEIVIQNESGLAYWLLNLLPFLLPL